MKVVLIAASALALGLVSAPAFAADPADSLYGTIGWAGFTDGSDNTLNAVQGRVGYRAMHYLGVEGEAAFGVGSTSLGSGVSGHLNNSAGAYAVGYLPVSPQLDLFARAGWAEDNVKVSGGGSSISGNANGFAWGGGGQYFWDGKNGVRADWTRQDFNRGVNANVWGVSYARKF
jgi:hypothetical protein